MKEKVIVIAGPTAVGKSGLGVKLAKLFNGEIISADSIQIYKNADIGSAKITPSEQCGINHHLLSFLDVNDSFSAGEFSRLAANVITDITSRGKVPIIVGGTGLYINSLLFPLTSSCPKNEILRKQLLSIKEKEGNIALWNKLDRVDHETAKLLHVNQTDRIIRAIEIYETSGVKKSQLSKTQSSPYDYVYFVLNAERSELYIKINERVDKMMEDGLVSEVQNLINNHHLNETSPLLFGIGYREIFDYLNGKITLNESIELIKTHSRNYAKRQLTWFKKAPGAIMVSISQTDEIITKTKEFLNG